MKREVTLVDCSDDSSFEESVELAPTCPICGVAISPEVLHGAMVPSDKPGESKIYILNFCNKCCKCFISSHYEDTKNSGYSLENSAPTVFVEHHFPETVCNLSPDFVSIYNESLRAEIQGMTSICGMGYRKALEFLIKDYAIHLIPNETEFIKSATLAQTIKKYISDEKIRSLATASSWIGNDETHYIRKHQDYGIKELKSFIMTASAFIDYNLSYEEARKLIKNQ